MYGNYCPSGTICLRSIRRNFNFQWLQNKYILRLFTLIVLIVAHSPLVKLIRVKRVDAHYLGIKSTLASLKFKHIKGITLHYLFFNRNVKGAACRTTCIYNFGFGNNIVDHLFPWQWFSLFFNKNAFSYTVFEMCSFHITYYFIDHI
jgi:hypothetical protein